MFSVCVIVVPVSTRAEHIQEVEAELAAQEEQLARQRAVVLGLRLRLSELRAGNPDPTPLSKLSYSDAVVEVLRQDGGVLSPQKIHDRLVEAGREDEPRSLGGILQALKRQGRVERVARAQWAIADEI